MAGKGNGAAAPDAAGRPARKKPAASAEPSASPPAEAPAKARKPRAAKAAAATAPAAPAGPRIFHIFFEPWQRDLVDPAFVPLDNRGEPTEYLEFDLFERLSISDHVKGVPLWGALSWRFTEKTGLTGADLLRLIEANPGHDIYFCNAYPQHEGLYHNLWMQGETAHPRFLELVRAFLAAAGLPDDTNDIVPSKLYSTANYFVGSPAFWEAYLPFVRGAIVRADRNLPAEIRALLHSTAADERGVHGGTTYMPFIVERLLPLFLRTAGRHLKGFQLPLSLPEDEVNVHLRLLREMKDTAWRTRSAWLAVCWVNYRNLYLTQQHGRDWTRKHLRAVTPTEIKFA